MGAVRTSDDIVRRVVALLLLVTGMEKHVEAKLQRCRDKRLRYGCVAEKVTESEQQRHRN